MASKYQFRQCGLPRRGFQPSRTSSEKSPLFTFFRQELAGGSGRGEPSVLESDVCPLSFPSSLSLRFGLSDSGRGFTKERRMGREG